MTLTTKQQVIIILVVAATSAAIGRYTVPYKIKTEIKTVEVERKSSKVDDKTNIHKHKDTTTTTVKKPDGTVETTTKVSEDTNTGKNVVVANNDQVSANSDSKTEKTANTGHLNISVLASVNPFAGLAGQSSFRYGAIVTRDMIGPISCSLFGFSDGSVGAGIGLTF